jgi:hypothetical protein
MKDNTNVSWRQQKKGFPYKDDPLTDKKYLKDRAELFHEHGNGWWWHPEKIKLIKRKPK